MNCYLRPKILTVLPVVLFVVASVLAHLFAQTPQPSPSPTGSPSPSPSPSPTRSPSPTPLPGAQNFHQWGSITVFNGLPSDSVRAIAQTPDAVMWFGTDNGLARFDGRRVQTMAIGNGDVDRILALETSPTGELWIGTSSGAFVYADNRFQPIANTEGKVITAVFLGTSVFLGTDDGFVLRVGGDAGVPVAEQLISEPIRSAEGAASVITTILETNGRLLVGTTGRGVVVIRNGVVDEAVVPNPGTVNALARTGPAGLWLGADAAKGVSGIYSTDANGSRTARVAAPTAKVLTLEANDSGIWAGTERYGLFQVVDGKLKKSYTFENTSGGLRSDTVYTLFTDREGVLWIGTNRGASRFDRLGASQETVSDIPNSNFVRTLLRRDDGKFLAGTNRGLFISEDDTWRPVPGFDNKSIYAIAQNRNGGTLVGTSTGLFDFSGRLIAPGDVRGFANFQKRTYAAVYGRGILQLSNSDGVPSLVSPFAEVTSLSEAADRLWVGTAGAGLMKFDGDLSKEIDPDVVKSGTMWRMFPAADGTLWIAGQHGVFRVKDSVAERIAAAEEVRDVLVDDDEFWAATTTRGLLHGRNDPKFGWLVTVVGFEQGLPSEKAFSIIPDPEGALLIATNRGVVTYKPGLVPPKIIATRVLSQRVHDLAEIASSIPLEYPQNSLLVEVAGQSSRTFPEEFQYAFVLKNPNGDEIARQLSNDPQYAPTDLKPGDYAIEAIAFNRDLLASEPLTISFSVAKAPFPWTATALAVLLVLALVGLAWAIIEHRRIVQRNRELAAARLDLANEAERERRRIARDLHDQTLADLRNLMMTTDKMAAPAAGFREEIESISTDIRRICEDLSPSVLENVGLVAALEFLLTRTVANSSFVADESMDEQIAFPLNVQLQIYRIAQEVLTNIDRHSNANEVEMKVEIADSDFVLSIRDDGRAFDPEDVATRGRGISNIRARANLINGRAAWKESRRGGNVFSLRIGT